MINNYYILFSGKVLAKVKNKEFDDITKVIELLVSKFNYNKESYNDFFVSLADHVDYIKKFKAGEDNIQLDGNSIIVHFNLSSRIIYFYMNNILYQFNILHKIFYITNFNKSNILTQINLKFDNINEIKDILMSYLNIKPEKPEFAKEESLINKFDEIYNTLWDQEKE